MVTDPQIIHNALASLPSGLFVMTCAHDQFRTGTITHWVGQCSHEPPLLVVSIRKGQIIEPMLRDARAFVLNMMPIGDRRSILRFGKDLQRTDDPFLSVDFDTATTGMPILKHALGWFDCELEGHLSPDADCRLYLGKVVAAHMSPQVKIKQTVAISVPIPDDRSVQRSTVKKIATRQK
ncbi:MAG: flavin reductase family protein [Phycisphaerales bacterium]|jgi:flavin reductase (DIM6/NTAB) family NADH-FMN oxidoreductase RutF|nr:flavin reductase family protein [Phycisphaerales bacterium]